MNQVDPQKTLWMMLQALHEENYAGCVEAMEVLRNWLHTGGYYPKIVKAEESGVGWWEVYSRPWRNRRNI